MAGKGKKRREKNYLAAHGGSIRLPPPPDVSKLDALPSKLRQLLSFASASPKDSAKASVDNEEKKKRNREDGGDGKKKTHTAGKVKAEATVLDDRSSDRLVISPNVESADDVAQNNGGEKRKKKRKRKEVKDLRFDVEMELEGRSKRRERKKKYWEAKKKKKKNGKTVETLNFPGHEKIKFGDVVMAPPKLVVVPRAPKLVQSASKERQRLQAIEAYRNRKGWTSRLGLQFPPTTT